MLTPAARPPRPAFFGAAIAILLVLGIGSSIYVYTQIDRTNKEHLLDRAATIAAFIPASEVTALSGSEADLASPEYQSLKALLIKVEGANHDTRFIYLMSVDDTGTFFFYADSEDPSSDDYSPPGERYYDTTPAMREVMSKSIRLTDPPARDQWGLWISGYAPIIDANGKTVALLGMDIPAYAYFEDVLAYSSLPLLVMLLLIAVVVMLERSRRREREAIEQKAEFLSIASHEIRTPLTGIRWAIEDILKGSFPSAGEQVRSTLELVHDNCLSLIARVNNLLDLTAIENRGKIALKKETIAMQPFAEDIRDSLALSAKQRGITIRLDGSMQGDGSFSADRQMMHHAFFNLLTNAIKYTRENTEVLISYEEKDGMHRFKFSDHGMGISAEEQAHLFEGYYRSKEAIRSGQYGTGLGLYLVKRAAELHGGRIDVESTPGTGSTFILSVPV